MNVGHKSSSTQVLRLMVYRRALHPELFELHGRRCDRHGDYEVESWVAKLGHIVRFQVQGESVTEAVIDNGDHLPEHGLVYALPCLGEKEFELDGDQDKTSSKVGFVTTLQTESLTDNLYLVTLREMQDFAAESDALSYDWKDPDGVPCLSVLDTQKYKQEFHVQSYHLLGGSGMVLRTQSIFEIRS